MVAAIPPGNEKLFRMAVDIAAKSITLNQEETEKIAALAESADALFPAVEGDA